MSNLAIARLQKEVTMLQRDPPPGAWAGPIDGKPLTELEARIQGPPGTVYERGVFKLSIHIPTRYPMEPPKIRFVTPVYHPNIDAEGRICLDLLNPPPKGAWKPSLNVGTLLTSIALLLAEPNPDDGLVTDTTYEYKHRREVFDAKARAWTRQHATQGGDGAGPSGAAAAGPGEAKPDGNAAGGDGKCGEAPADGVSGGEAPGAGEGEGAAAEGKENGGGGAGGKAPGEGQLGKQGRPPLGASQDAPDPKRAKTSPAGPSQDA